MARQPPVMPIALDAFGDGSSSSYNIPQMEISSSARFMDGNINLMGLSGAQLVHPQAVNFYFVPT
jgi:hypothetical protein